MRYNEREVVVEVMYPLMGIVVNNVFHTHTEVVERNALSTSPPVFVRRHKYIHWESPDSLHPRHEWRSWGGWGCHSLRQVWLVVSQHSSHV